MDFNMQSASTAELSELPSKTFLPFNFNQKIISELTKKGIVTPTPIQEQAIPVALQGKDIVGIAQTGTGKTLAFALPIIEKLQAGLAQALILVPTRELAAQVDETFRAYCEGQKRRVSTVILIGGASMHLQKQRLFSKPNVIVATPGRLQDHLNQRTLNLSKVGVVVLDEADRMFDMGFAPQIRKILSVVPEARQTMLFSATMPPEIASLANRHLKDPVRIEVSPQGTSVAKIRQEICYVGPENKDQVLQKILAETSGTTLIFSRTKHGARSLTQKVKRMGYSAAEIHSNLSLSQRRLSLAGFKAGKYQILVATDIAARGIDVDDIELVVNYDLPDASADYVHRIGRTGRAGKEGRSVSLALRGQLHKVREIEFLTKSPLEASVHSQAIPTPKVLHRSGGRGNGGRGGGFRRR